MIALLCFFLTLFASPFKSKSRLEAENAALRHQLIVLQRRVSGRVQLTNGDRLFLVMLYRWLPAHRPRLTLAERLRRKIDRIDPSRVRRPHCRLGRGSLRRILGEYAAYYNASRTHRSLDKDAPVSRPVQRIGSIRSHPFLGGLHHHSTTIGSTVR